MNDAVIFVSAVRTAVTGAHSTLKGTRPDELGAVVITEKRFGAPPASTRRTPAM